MTKKKHFDTNYQKDGAWHRREFPINCLDTDLLIAILRGKKEAYSKVVALDEDSKGAATTAINAFEIFFGAYKSKMQSENLKETQRLLDRLNVIPLDFSSSKRAAEISANLSTIGEPIDYRDAMIAAVALENDLTLLTHNKSHFARINNLKLETW